ncbi:MAG: Gfo/Idh/MocA family oxidoreductase [Akkermansiaceae bacterium]|nr:Gfo/Idh/MocA family oxidoreductase [Akkermansiaceae bacterium]
MIHLRAQDGPANDEIAIGFIGVGRRGQVNMKNFLSTKGVRVVAVCDVDSKMTASAKAIVDKKYGNSDCRVFANHEDLLAMPGLDAICLSTADHWHARIGIDAANAGMDIFGEKPFTWGLAEGRELVKAVQANHRIWQTGCWQRSVNQFRRFKALIENDVLGKITRFECGTPNGCGIRKHAPEEKWKELTGNPPAHLDWDRYVGPAGDYTYHPMVHPWNWRWTSEFGGGQLLDWVGHHVDIAMWSLGLDHTGPVKVEGSGKKIDHPVFNVYTDYQYNGTFDDGRVFEVRSDFMGTKFTGENGWIWVNRGKLVASDDPKDTEGNPRHPLLMDVPDDFAQKVPGHYEDFINAMRSRKPAIAPEEPAHRAASFGQLALVALDTGRELRWDPQAEKVIGDDEQANHPRLGSRL